MRKTVCLLFICMVPIIATSQNLRVDSKVTEELKSGESITFYSTTDCSTCYYYLPANLKISRKKNMAPEVSFVTWKNDDDSKVIGGILHFLVNWGISSEEEKFLSAKLRANRDSLAVILGPASIFGAEEGPNFSGDQGLSDLLTAHLTQPPLAPTTPGAKLAFSFRFGEEAVDAFMGFVKEKRKVRTKLIVPFAFELVDRYGSLHQMQSKIELDFREVLELIQ